MERLNNLLFLIACFLQVISFIYLTWFYITLLSFGTSHLFEPNLFFHSIFVLFGLAIPPLGLVLAFFGLPIYFDISYVSAIFLILGVIVTLSFAAIKKVGGIFIIFFAVLLLGFENYNYTFKNDCVINLQSYKEVAIRVLATAGNVEPNKQFDFNADLNEIHEKIKICPSKEKEELQKVTIDYYNTLLSFTDDALDALRRSDSNNLPPKFEMSEKTKNLVDNLRKQSIPDEMLDLLLSVNKMFDVVFLEWNEIPEHKRNVFYIQVRTMLQEYNRKSELAYEEMFFGKRQ